MDRSEIDRMIPPKTYPSRRIFINKGSDRYQIFSFDQHKDGSIYCGSPDFADAKWISYEVAKEGPAIKVVDSIGEGKLGVHGSGMTAIRNYNDPKGHKLIIRGNHLLESGKGLIGARHLFTAFLKEPSYMPKDSPAFNRASDYAIQANENLRPFVLVFFAVPRQEISVEFMIAFNVDEMDHIPGDLLGLHHFGLRHHEVFWFAYRTKHMEKWPKYPHFCYHDGYSFPVFIGTGPQAFRLEFRQPNYSLNGKTLAIRV